MKRIIVHLLILLTLIICGNSAMSQTPLQAQLTKIENEVWGFSYEKEDDITRIERIEKQIFGVPNPKIGTDKRVDKITKSLGLETQQEAKSSLADLYIPEKSDSSVEYPQVDRLEGILLGSVYKNENIYTRLERLEKKVFGAKQEGDLAQRTEALNRHASISMPEAETEQTATKGYQTRSYYDNSYQVDPNSYRGGTDDIKLQLAALENMIFATDFSQEPIPLRLSRLENKIFQRNFADDADSARILRIRAATSASKTAKFYDNNKFQKFASSGIQAATFLLMILAFIL